MGSWTDGSCQTLSTTPPVVKSVRRRSPVKRLYDDDVALTSTRRRKTRQSEAKKAPKKKSATKFDSFDEAVKVLDDISKVRTPVRECLARICRQCLAKL